MSGAGAGMHTGNHEKNKPHKRNSCFSRGFFWGGVGGEGLLVLQLLQAVQGLSTSPDEATELDASLQGGARAQFG